MKIKDLQKCICPDNTVADDLLLDIATVDNQLEILWKGKVKEFKSLTYIESIKDICDWYVYEIRRGTVPDVPLISRPIHIVIY